MSLVACLLYFLSTVLLVFAQSSSGSGAEDTGCMQCVPPRDALPIANLTTSLAEAVLEARCLAACLHLQVQNDSALVHEGGPYLYLLQSDLEEDCTLYHQVYDCARGCVSGSRVNNATKCSQDCMSQCEANVDFGDSDVCAGSCDITQCTLGCSAYEMMKNGENSMLKPGKPRSPLDLLLNTSPETVGVYVVGVDDDNDFVSSEGLELGSGQPSDLLVPDAMADAETLFVTFVFQVVEEEQLEDVYLVKAGLPSNLSFDFFSCEDVAISYTLVDEHGASPFSDPVELTVEGVIQGQPEAPYDLSCNWHYDARQGFFGHLCMNLSWANPMGLRSIKYFEVSYYGNVNVDNCGVGEMRHIEPVPGALGHTMLCATNKTNAFVIDCSYSLTMISMPALDCAENRSISHVIFDCDNPEYVNKKISEFQNLNLSCSRRFNHDDNNFVMDLTIQLSDYLFHEKVIKGFKLVLAKDEFLPGVGLDEDTLRSPYIKKMPVDTSTFTESYYGLPPRTESDVNYTVVVKPEWVEGMYEPNILTSHCSISALSERPDVIKMVTLNSLTVMQGSFSFKMEANWSKPESFNGAFDKYEVVITNEVLAPDTREPSSSADKTVISEMDTTYVNMVSLYHPSARCYYLQVRSFNKYLPSNWSEPVALVLNGPCYVHSVSSLFSSVTRTTVATPSPPRTSTEQAKISSTVYIPLIGVSILVLSVVCVMSLLCGHWIIRRRKRRLELVQEDFDPMFRSGPRRPSVHNMVSILPATDEWEIPPNQIVIEDCLGQGAFGEVYKGFIMEPIDNLRMKNIIKQCGSNAVAVKLLKTSAAGSERSDFIKEIDMMKKIAEGNNPHVVNMIGCVTLQEPLCLVTEFVKYGDLLSYLRTTRKQAAEKHMSEAKDRAEVSAYFEDPYPELSELMPVDLISFAYQIASGMEFLSSLGIVHRDLACRNILVGEGKSLKISDFGMSREVGTGADDAYVKTTKGRLPLKWMAIESIVNREFTAASDVWSFGVLLWEIGTLGGFPYPTLQNEDLLMFLRRGHRMEKPDNCSPEIYEIMLECWHDCPQKRPTFTQLRAKFDSLLAAQQCNVYIDLQTDEQQDIYKTDLNNDGDNQLSTGSSDSSVFERSPALSHRSVASGKSVESGYLTVTNAWDQQSGNEPDGPGLSPAIRNTRLTSPRLSPGPSRLSPGPTQLSPCPSRLSPGPSRSLSPNPCSETNLRRPLSLVLRDTEARKENPYVDEPFERKNPAGIVIQVSSSSPSSPTTTPRASRVNVISVRNPLFQ